MKKILINIKDDYLFFSYRTSINKEQGNLLNTNIISDNELVFSEDYINNMVKSGHNVLICNPSLVETGLNLLDFTTIVFYQLGYNLNN